MPNPVGQSSLQMTVNALSLDYSDDTRRKPTPCQGCGELTTGRAEISGNGQTRKIAACMTCAMNQVMGTVVGSIPRMIREALR